MYLLGQHFNTPRTPEITPTKALFAMLRLLGIDQPAFFTMVSEANREEERLLKMQETPPK
jgi:hypothetical protein